MTDIVEFPSEMRVHISLDVRDVEAATAFYRLLRGTDPAKQKTQATRGCRDRIGQFHNDI